jgi:uncharacterized membrane protein YqjE
MPGATSNSAEAGIADSAKGLVATLLATLETRLRLLGLDLEDQSSRLLAIFLFGIAAVTLFVFGIVASALLLVLVLWDTHRPLAVGFVLLAFFAPALLSGLICVYRLKTRPHLFQASLGELNKDLSELRTPTWVDR